MNIYAYRTGTRPDLSCSITMSESEWRNRYREQAGARVSCRASRKSKNAGLLLLRAGYCSVNSTVLNENGVERKTMKRCGRGDIIQEEMANMAVLRIRESVQEPIFQATATYRGKPKAASVRRAPTATRRSVSSMVTDTT